MSRNVNVSRNELKGLKKSILSQLKEGIKPEYLSINGFYNSESFKDGTESTYYFTNEIDFMEIRFQGRLTAKELKGQETQPQSNFKFEILVIENEGEFDIGFSVETKDEDKEVIYITLNI